MVSDTEVIITDGRRKNNEIKGKVCYSYGTAYHGYITLDRVI